MKEGKNITIGKKIIGDGHPVFIIAEMSCNHQQDINQAKAIIKAAAQAGADAIKLQTYTPDTMTIDCRKKWFIIGADENPDTWKGKTFYEIYQEAYTPWEWHSELQEYAINFGLEFFSTPFDHTAVDFLETLGVPCYKVASYEATDIPLLKKIAKTGKPIIMSVGFADLPEIELSVKTLRDNGTKDLVLLHCTTSYSKNERADHTNLRAMLDMKERFEVLTGFSDNMGGIEIPALAAAMGAVAIEKHLVLKHDPAVLDDTFSLDPVEFKQMVDKIRWQEKAMGEVLYGPRTKAEEDNRRYRRSLFVVKDIKKGESFTVDNVRSIRPADGLETKFFDDVLGGKASQDIERGTPLSWDLVLK